MKKTIIITAVAMVFWSAVLCGVADATVYQSPNFAVTCSDGPVAIAAVKQMERSRRELSIEWFGRELPVWENRAVVSIRKESGGIATYMSFTDHVLSNMRGTWRYTSTARLLSDTVPHEVQHLVMASHYGGRLPRWIDEGLCVSAESDAEHLRYIKLGRLRHMPVRFLFKYTRYPSTNIMSFYGTSFAWVNYLMTQGTRFDLLRCLNTYYQTGSWDVAFKKIYGRSTAELEKEVIQFMAHGQPSETSETSETVEAARLRDLFPWTKCPTGTGICNPNNPKITNVEITPAPLTLPEIPENPLPISDSPEPYDPPPEPPPAVVEIDYQKLAAAIYQTYGQLLIGPKGNQGEPGKPVDMQGIIEAVIDQMPPIHVQFIGDGGVVDSLQSVKPGDTLKIPPVRFEIHHADGDWSYQERPLGKPIALQLSPQQ